LERFLIHIGGVASTSLSFLKGPFGTEIPSVLDGSLDRNRLGAASRVLATR
jgi:hypothetical protein